MIEINLLPGARKAKASARRSVDFAALAAGLSGRVKDKFLIGSIAAVILGAAAVGYLYVTQARREKEITAHHEKAVRDSTRYANLLKDRYKSEAIRDTLLRQVNIITTLDEDRYVWPHVLDEVSRALPQYTWITLLQFIGAPQGQNNVVITPKSTEDTSAAAKKKAHPPKRLETEIPKDVVQFRITGHTVSIEALTRYIKDLEASPFLGDVTIERAETALDQGKEVTQFSLMVNYTRPDPSILHRVPLVLSTNQDPVNPLPPAPAGGKR